jgi:hypothetical protein
MAGYLRFRRTLRVAPGIRLNLSKRGLSTSFGPRGLHYTVGHGRRRTTVGMPGTGLWYTTYSQRQARSWQRAAAPAGAHQTRATAPRTTPASTTASLAEMAAMTPPQKIAWGILFTLLVITSPVGLWLLITGLVQLHSPVWRIRTYVRQAGLEPANAAELLARAAAIDPDSPEVLAPLAECKTKQGDNAAALDLYRRYCARVPSDWVARGHRAAAALHCNQIDEAIAELVAIRRDAPATGDSMASVTAHLAYAYLCKEDPQQALSLVEASPARTGKLGPGSEQCLFYLGVCEYMLGRTGDAVTTLANLYAINPDDEGLQAVRDAMSTQTYELLLPDGTALAPVNPGHVTRSAAIVQRTAPRSPHCLNCQAPLAVGAMGCPYCHAGVAVTQAPLAPPPPPPGLPLD